MPSPRYWREIPARYRLEGGRCPACGKVTYPTRRVCPECRHEGMEAIALSRHGRVVTFTTIHVAPTEFQMEAPYPMAVVETPEGARLMVQVADCAPDDVKLGLEVALEFRRIQREGRSGILCYGHKAVPAR
ncbi:MAG: Zn-ribbon domain-containing OB-fold protein [Gemmatimonadota bacterium]|nr:Zn-ribbon domain-containing OB-fold protein [Gemmatimonadota bacterium]MDH4351805.1 Zn-ribbon domain-containing OB-fold protein [Gemmatimonadota bacterium]